MRLTDKQIVNITDILKRHPVQLAYLFGSQVSGKTGTLSDIDIGVLLENRTMEQTHEQILTTIFVELTRALHTDFIDLIDLEKASTLLAYNIVTKGRLLCTKDATFTHRFAFHTIQQFEDFRFHLDTQQRLIKQRLLANL